MMDHSALAPASIGIGSLSRFFLEAPIVRRTRFGILFVLHSPVISLVLVQPEPVEILYEPHPRFFSMTEYLQVEIHIPKATAVPRPSKMYGTPNVPMPSSSWMPSRNITIPTQILHGPQILTSQQLSREPTHACD